MPEMNYYAALGLEEPAAEEGAREPEVAAPAEEGANEQEIAAPAEETGEESAEPEEPESHDSEPEEPEPGNQPQSKAERAANAQRRRQREREAELRQAREQASSETEARLREEFNRIIAQAGLNNPFDGKKPVSKLEELDAYNKARLSKQLERDLQEGKLTPESLSVAVENSKPFQRLKAQLAQQTSATEQADDKRRELAIKEQMAEVTKLDPTLKEPKDFLSMPDYDSFKSYVDRGMSFVEALKLMRYDSLVNAKAEKAAQATLQKAAGKAHLTSSRSQGSGAVAVPADVMQMYRQLNPGVSDAEIQAHYNKHKH